MNRHANRLHLPILFALLATPALAQSITFTDHCENNSSAAERDIIRAAYDFVYEHRYDVWNEIDRRRADRNVEGYEDVSDTRRNRWLREIESVTMNCEIGGCSRDSNLYGHCGMATIGFGVLNPWDRTAVCIDNLQALATSCGNPSAVAYVAGTLAHEVMHQCDGWEGHPLGGTLATDPQTDAETIGIAMEHMALTPDLAVSITGMQQKVDSAGVAYLEVTVRIENRNQLSGPTSTVGRSGRSRHADTLLGVCLDGVLAATTTVAPIAGGDSRSATVSIYRGQGYSPTRASYTVRAVADWDDTMTEYEEDNNDDTETFDPDCDLAITRLEITGPYTNVFYRGGAARRLSYDVEVANQSSKNHSPTTVLRQIGPVAGRLSCSNQTQDLTLPALAPGATATLRITVDVPVSSLAVHGSLWLGADPDYALRDEVRGNNEYSLTYTADYFQPDYTVWFDELAFLESGGVLAKFTVKNIGPLSGGACQARLAPSSGTMVTRPIAGLDAAASASYQFEVTDCFVLMGRTVDFTLTIDSRRAVDESDEDNNVASAWLQNGVDIASIPNMIGVTLVVDEPHWIDTARYGWIENQLRLLDGFLWTHSRTSSSGPFLERPSACFVKSDLGTFLVSFLAPLRALPAVQPIALSQQVRYQALRLMTGNGPTGQGFGR